MFPYEILIRGRDGKYSGSHMIVLPGESAVAIADLPAEIAAINAGALARVAEIEIELEAAKEKYTALASTATQAAQAVVQVVQDESVNLEQTAATCLQIACAVLTPVTERERIALERRIAEAQAKLAAL